MKLDAARALGPPGRLSRYEQDAILARVEASRTGWLRRHQAHLGAAFAVVAVAVALILIVPSTSSGDKLTARGRAGFSLVLRCGERDPGECRLGDRLAFDFGGAPPAGFGAMFARAETGRIIWYLPADEETPSVDLTLHAKHGVFDSVAVIDATYAPGTYELFAVVSPQPLSRAEIRAFAQSERLVAPAGVQIENRTFVIREETQR